MAKNNSVQLFSKDKAFVFLIVSAVITVVLWNVPLGPQILYPFSILGTWFHEMGHGIMSMLMGGKFDHLVIYENGSGIAYYTHTGNLLLGNNVSSALISAAGLLGPPIVGGLLIISGRKLKSAKVATYVLAVFMVVSCIIWVRTAVGIAVVGGIGAVLLVLATKGKPKYIQFGIQFLGVQACISTYRQLDYLFMNEIDFAGGVSDTGNIANNLFLPYWFWGGLIAVLSALIIILSVRKAYK